MIPFAPISKGGQFFFSLPSEKPTSSVEETTQKIAIRSLGKRERELENPLPPLRTRVKTLRELPCAEELDPEEAAYWEWFEETIVPHCKEEGRPITDPEFYRYSAGPFSPEPEEPSVCESPFASEDSLGSESFEEAEAAPSELDSPLEERRVADIPVTTPAIFYKEIFPKYYPIGSLVKYGGNCVFQIIGPPQSDGTIQIKNKNRTLKAPLAKLKPILEEGQTVFVLLHDAYFELTIMKSQPSRCDTDIPSAYFDRRGEHCLQRILPKSSLFKYQFSEERRALDIPLVPAETFYQTLFPQYYPLGSKVKYAGNNLFTIGSVPEKDGSIQIRNQSRELRVPVADLKPSLSPNQTVFILDKGSYFRCKIERCMKGTGYFTDVSGFRFNAAGKDALHRILPLPPEDNSSKT